MVSIITPSYNSEKFISESIKSVLNQSFSDWEMIIVDDCSTDSSVDVIQSFVNQDKRIKLIQLQDNCGAAVARNTAIREARGRYIAFLDSDDVWLPSKLEKQISFMKAHHYPFTFTAYDKIDENGMIFERFGVQQKVSYSNLLKTCSIGCLTSVYDTNYFGKVYMPLIRKRQDFGLWLKLLKKTDYAFGLNETLAVYRVRSDSISADKASASKFTWRLYRDFERLNIFQASYYFSHYAIYGLLRTKVPYLAKLFGILK